MECVQGGLGRAGDRLGQGAERLIDDIEQIDERGLRGIDVEDAR